MPAPSAEVLISGLGIVSALGRSIAEFRHSLEHTATGIRRTTLEELPGRSVAAARVNDWSLPALIDAVVATRGHARTRSQIQRLLSQSARSTQLSVSSVNQAWNDARLDAVHGDSIALLVAGNNLTQTATSEAWSRHAKLGTVPVRHAIAVQDTSQVGCLSELFGLRGPGWTVGAASASGNAALYQGWNIIRAGIAPVCLVVGAAMELSLLEWESFEHLGAMAPLGESEDAAAVHRPFDQEHRGFVWGEASACVVLEHPDHAQARAAAAGADGRGPASHGALLGASFLMDASSGPDPTLDGEIRAMRSALAAAGLTPSEIGYVNAHGTGSPLGDTIESEALQTVFGSCRPLVNSTKPLTGHCLTSAGVVEAIACLLQLNHGFAHGNPNLKLAASAGLNLAGPGRQALATRYAMSNGFAFGGLNSSIILRGART